MYKKLLMVALSSGLLIGCTTTAQDCDPSYDNGFFNKMGCVFSGSYAQRTDDLQATIDDAQRTNEALKKLNALLSDRQALVNGSMLERSNQLSEASRQVNSLRNDLNAKAKNSEALNQKLNDLENSLNQANDNSVSKTIAEKQRQYEQLQKDYDAILELM